jgi:hypothetical protein
MQTDDPKSDPPLEALASRLRSLPEPPVPADLEARLLRAISRATPARVSTEVAPLSAERKQEWFALAATVLALAMVGLLAIFAWRDRGENDAVSVAQTSQPPSANASSDLDDLNDVVMSPIDRRILSGAGLSSFNWPVQEIPPARASSAIPTDLLNQHLDF